MTGLSRVISTSNYQIKTPRINLTGTGPWNIKVVKVDLGENHFEVKYTSFEDISQNTALSNKRGNQIVWTSLIESQNVRSAYPYCVTAGLSISTRQFPSLPTRAYEIKGRIISVPANARVRSDGSLEFLGSFNGTLKQAWTTCPVCCFYDMVTNPRYGAGDFVTAANMSWVDLYPLAQYANQLVTTPEGTAGTALCLQHGHR
jgi:predicted phage tail protein